MTELSRYVKAMRKEFGLTQVDLSQKSGVGLRFVRELEQGKETLRLDKVNQVLALFGSEMQPGKKIKSWKRQKYIANVFSKFSKTMPKWSELIKQSYLPEDKQMELQTQIDRMASRINLIWYNLRL